MKQLRGFKFRFTPNSSQRLQLAQTFGCTRFVFNWGLNLRTDSYYNQSKPLSYRDTSNALTKLKKEEDKTWLKDVSSVPLQQGLRHLNTAFENFFKKRGRYPRFKKKHGRQRATYAPNAFSWKDGKLTLAKMKQPLLIKWSRYMTGEPRQVIVSKDPANRYFVSFLVEEELTQWNKTKDTVGIDLGIKDVVVTSKGFASGNPKYLAKYQAKLKTLQRKLSRKQKGSQNREEARLKVARLHAKIADCRKDFLHKLTTQLVRENQTICTETLMVKNMMANHKLASSIADCGWGELIRQLEYKSDWHDRNLVKIDRFFPSSKRCNPCGYILDKLPLQIREWSCPRCNNVNSRDANAALNILAIGRSLGGQLRASPYSHARPNQEGVGLTLIACGESQDRGIINDRNRR